MKTAVAYIRVSKLKEDAVSPASQLQLMRNWCEANGVQLIEVFRDLDISGREYARHQRDELQRLIERVREGGIDYVLVYKFDRLTRGGARDFYRIVDGFERVGTAVVSISENIDTSTAIGEIMRDMLLGWAKAESERIGERIRDNLMYVVKHKRKWIGGVVPFGYSRTKEGLVVDPAQAEIVRWIFERYAAGDGARVICRDLNVRGIPPPGGGVRWHYSTLRGILMSRVYLGETKWRGDWHPANHEPIIDERLWRAATARRQANTHVGSAPEYPRLLTGLIRCGLCGRTGNIKHGWQGTLRYYCTTRSQVGKRECPNIALDEVSLVDRIRSLLSGLGASRVIRAAERALPVDGKVRDVEAELRTIDRRLRQIKTLLDRLFSDHYEHGLITREQFAEQNRRYLEEQASLMERREQLVKESGHTALSRADLEMVAEATDALAAAWEHVTPVERRMGLLAVIREIRWTPERAVIEWKWGAETLLEYHAVRSGVAFFDDRWMHACPGCGRKFGTGRAVSMHLPYCKGGGNTAVH